LDQDFSFTGGIYSFQAEDQSVYLESKEKIFDNDNEEAYQFSDLENDVFQEPHVESQQKQTLQEEVPPLHNKYSNNFWKDERPLKLFRMVFSEEWYYEEIKWNYQMLQELPGGGTSNLDFIHILTDVGTDAFLKEGPWKSTYGSLGYKLRISIYNEDKKGLRWARRNIPGQYNPFSKERKSVLGLMQEGTKIQ
jgi:hypothetical protein